MRRVLIISASIGGGHVAAARALETSFEERPEAVTVKHVDLLDYTTAPFRRFYRQTYFDLVQRAPEFVDWLGKRLDRSPGELKSRQERALSRLTRLVSYYLPRLVESYQPDVVVHTHFLAPEILGTRLAPDLLRLRNSKPLPQMVVITDFFAHSLWMQRGVSRYFVASQEVAVHLAASGIDSERVTVSGIPIDSRFARLETKLEARAALGYAPGRDLVLMMASGLDAGTLKKMLEQLKHLRWPLTVTLVCGRSPELMRVAKEASATDELDDPLVSFDLVDFTTEMPRYMAAADLLLGKPGGLTSSEALAAGLPFAIVQPYPVQEEANTGYLLEHGAALRIDPLSVLGYKVKRFLENEETRGRMRGAAHAIAHPNAAAEVAAVVGEESA